METRLLPSLIREEDAEEIVNLIIRNFREVNVKDYGNEDKIVGVGSISSFWGSFTEIGI